MKLPVRKYLLEFEGQVYIMIINYVQY